MKSGEKTEIDFVNHLNQTVLQDQSDIQAALMVKATDSKNKSFDPCGCDVVVLDVSTGKLLHVFELKEVNVDDLSTMCLDAVGTDRGCNAGKL